VGQKAVKTGTIENTLHAPIFPVSDDKGYEHFGAFRYGRGLTAEPGGTFEFIHSGQDPFNNVTPETAELFVQALTLSKAGQLADQPDIISRAVQALPTALTKVVDFVSNAADEAAQAEVQGPPPPPATERLKKDTQAALIDVITVAEELGRTSRGREALRELLEANGDDPNLIDKPNWNIEQTQFANNFANFAANYGKSPVFKTTVSNAAYQLTDLTSHLLSNTGAPCRCRGAHADVMFQAWTKKSFVSVPGVNPADDPATAEHSERILIKGAAHLQRQNYLRGRTGMDNAPSAEEYENAGDLGTTAGVANVPPGGAAPSGTPEEMVTPENPPTTADPADIPPNDVDADTGVSPPVEDAGIEEEFPVFGDPELFNDPNAETIDFGEGEGTTLLGDPDAEFIDFGDDEV
jgi:hypothetical protein